MRRAYKSTRHVVVIAVAVAGLCGLGACGGQTSQSSDPAPTVGAGATSIFLAARWVRARAIATGLASSRAAVEGNVASADLRCSGIAAEAPRGTELDELNYDALVAVEIVMAQGSSAAMTRFASLTEGLRWGQTRLSLLVRRLAGEERALTRVDPLDICAVLADWARSGYRALPKAATRFQREISAFFPSRGAIRCRHLPPNGRSICSLQHQEKPTMQQINNLLHQYEDGKQREIARETKQAESDMASRMRATLSAAAAALTQHLGLDPFALRLFDASLKEL